VEARPIDITLHENMLAMFEPATHPAHREQWSNWDGRQACAPAVIERPATAGELSAALERAAREGRRVRTAGSGHSFTGLARTDGMLITLERMARVLDVDRSSGLVRVQAGMPLGRLNAELDRYGLALENLGDIDVQTIAGATATGTHGTGAKLRNLSAQIVALELMLSDGSTITVDAGHDPDAYRAARVGLGALGVVTAVTLQAVPAFRLRGVDGPHPLEATLDRLDALDAGHDHFELYWFPYTDTALTRCNDRTDDPPTRRSRARAYLEDIVLVNHGLEAFSRAGRRFPGQVPRFNRVVTRVAGSSERVDASHRIFTSPRLVRFTEMEYAIPRAHGAAAVRAVRDGIHRHGFPINFPIELRFVAGDDAFLSPAHGRDTCYIAVHTFDGMAFEPYFRMVEEIMTGFGGRPHWGKRHFQSAATLRPRYPQWDRFQAVRGRLDPSGRFANAELDRVLGPVTSNLYEP
jgi:L-gulono-1,4-lactone dehydrogenase